MEAEYKKSETRGGFGQLTVTTSVGNFAKEESWVGLFDTWLGNDDYEIHVFYEEKEDVFKALLYLNEITLQNSIENCIIEILEQNPVL